MSIFNKTGKTKTDFSNLHEIFCPYCMRKYPANNVVFRRPVKKNGSGTGIDTSDYAIDPYIVRYNAQFFEDMPANLPKTVDPAYVPYVDGNREYDVSGMLTGLKDIDGDQSMLTTRICPYCHNNINSLAGTKKHHIISVVGFKGSGKTTYESALIYALRQDHFGCINVSKNDHPNALEDGIQALRDGEEVNSTQAKEGPFHYQVSFGDESATNFLMNMVDLPGEKFVNSAALEFSGQAIPASDTCVFLVDLENSSTACSVLGSLISNFRKELERGNVNIAVVLYKADKLLKMFPDVPDFLTFRQERDYTNCAPIDMERIEKNSNDILRYVVQKDAMLDSLNTSLHSYNIPNENIRWFAAFSTQKGKLAPNNVEEPLLWSLARKGIYPVKN